MGAERRLRPISSAYATGSMDIIYSIPAGLLLAIVLVIVITIVGLGQFYIHRRFSPDDFVGHNEVGGILIAVSGSIYGVILGFLTVVAWQHFSEAREVTVVEADADIDAWHMSIGLPDAVRQRVRADMVQYASVMIDREWPRMRQGEIDETAAFIGMDAIDATGGFVPKNSGEATAQAMTLQQLDTLHDARQRRVAMNDSGVSWFEWVVLLIGAACIVCFCWLFGLRNARTQLVMTATVVTVIVSILVLLFELQYPFRSNVGIGSEAWQRALVHIREMQNSKLMDMR